MIRVPLLALLLALTSPAPAQDSCAQFARGFGPPGLQGLPTLLQPLNVGGVDKLFVSGSLVSAGNEAVSGAAFWNGHQWTASGTVLDLSQGESIRDLVEFDDGSGPATFAGGRFTTVNGGDHIGTWDGTSFFDVGGGIVESGFSNYWVNELVEFDDGGGSALFAGGFFVEMGGQAVQSIARWDGNTWSSVGAGPMFGPYTDIQGMCVFDDGSGPALFVGGLWTTSGVSKWDGVSWSVLGAGFSTLTGGQPRVFSLVVHDDGSGPALFAAGSFIAAGGAAVNLARWDGISWSPVGVTPATPARALFSWGSQLVLDGRHFWDGSSWSTPASPPSWGISTQMAEYDDGGGSKLIVAGSFLFIDDEHVAGIASFDGTTYAALGGGLGAPKEIDTLAVFDDGTGPRLAADYRHNTDYAIIGDGISLYDGTAWTPLGGATSGGLIEALESYDDGSGLALYAGGRFLMADGAPANRVARWDGSGWSALGTGVPGKVETLEVLDVGFGPVLFAGGREGSGISASAFLHAWDGTDWVPHEAPLTGSSVQALSAWDDPTTFGPDAHIGGAFQWANGGPSQNFAQLSIECPCETPTYCSAKQNSQGCWPSISTSGSTSLAAGDLTIDAGLVLNNKLGILIWSRARAELPFQGGVLCVAVPVTRTPVQQSGGNAGGTDCSGSFSFAVDAAYTTSKALLAGDNLYAQYWSRDAQSQGGASLSDAVQVLFCP